MIEDARGAAARLEAAIERLSPLEQSLPRLTRLRASPLVQLPLAPGSVGPRHRRRPGSCCGCSPCTTATTVSVLPGGRVECSHRATTRECRRPARSRTSGCSATRSRRPSGRRLPQVDFGRSVPTRAADALYWTNRAAERAEAMTRTMRVISSRHRTGPRTRRRCTAGRGPTGCVESSPAIVASGASTVAGADRVDIDVLHTELSLVGDAVAARDRLAADRGDDGSRVPVGDDRPCAVAPRRAAVVAAAPSHDGRRSRRDARRLRRDRRVVAGEHGAWTGLADRRHRSSARTVPRGARSDRRCVRPSIRPVDDVDSDGCREVDAAAIEVLLAANDSLVAYRRRYRSDVEVDAALNLLVHDALEPAIAGRRRSTRLAQHAADGESALGDEFVEHAPSGIDCCRSTRWCPSCAHDRHRGGRPRRRPVVLDTGQPDRDATRPELGR